MRWVLWVIGAVFCLFAGRVSAEANFSIVTSGTSVPIAYDTNDSPVVEVAAEALAGDIFAISSVTPQIEFFAPSGSRAILVGTLGQSGLIDQLVANGKISDAALIGKWETFSIQVVDNPFPGLSQGLVIAGSDPRGTAFGVFELSKMLGVSPWVYWADVAPEPRSELSVSLDQVLMGPPDVKYRGIFLNDEDFGLKPWAAQNVDTDVQDIGPKTYERIFELLLRLKANYIWPAMHGCTKAFFYYEGNQQAAAKYQIVVGASHCEPMLRNNVDEWSRNYKAEYGKEPGPWRYDTNSEDIHRYWSDRARQVKDQNLNAVFGLGMRGIHDGKAIGPETDKERVEQLNRVVQDQRAILSKEQGKPAHEIPQAFVPYSEVLELYNKGAVIPDDVTMVWADDNHGYIRKVSNPEEQQRSGGSGVYYHLSYWMPGQDYLWLSSVSPSLISWEMSKAYAYGADRLWVFNVGDLKPHEMEIEFAMDLAWDVDAWSPEKASTYAKHWAEKNFGHESADDIAAIKLDYYRLAAGGKPEHVNRVEYTEEEMNARLEAYLALEEKTTALQARIPTRLQDAYFQLVHYPVMGAAKMNEKIFYAIQGDGEAAKAAYDTICDMTRTYNEKIADGKWNGMMSMSPRSQLVYEMPAVQEPLRVNLQPAALETPMVLENGALYGCSPVACTASDGGKAVFTFLSEKQEMCDLYFEVLAPSPKEDSWFVDVNGKTVVANNHATHGEWAWVHIGSFTLEKGENQLRVSQREPNAKIRAIQWGAPDTRSIDSLLLFKQRLTISRFQTQGAMSLENDMLDSGTAALFSKSKGASASQTFLFDGWRQPDLYAFVRSSSRAPKALTIEVNGKKRSVDIPDTGGEWQWIVIDSYPIHKDENQMTVILDKPGIQIAGLQFGSAGILHLAKPLSVVSAETFQLGSNALHLISGLGVEGNAFALKDFRSPALKESGVADAPSAQVSLALPAGRRLVRIVTLPAFPVYEGRSLRVAVRLGNGIFKTVDVTAPLKSEAWFNGVFQGYFEAETDFELSTGGITELVVCPLDPGVAISRVEIY